MAQIDTKQLIHLILTAVCVVLSCTTLQLLIHSQFKQKWIVYEFVITGSNGGITFSFTTTADIGIWYTYFVLVQVYNPNGGSFVDSTTSDTLDSATTGYFSEAAVKACRGLAIIASISTFVTMVVAITNLVTMPLKLLSQKLTKIMNIIPIVSAGFTVFTATVALIVVRTQFKTGMSIATSYYFAIAADIAIAIALALFSVAFYLSTKTKVSPSPDISDDIKNNETQK